MSAMLVLAASAERGFPTMRSSVSSASKIGQSSMSAKLSVNSR